MRRQRAMHRQESDAVDMCYPMDLPRLGHALIINNVSSEISTSRNDVDALQEAYENLGFDIHVHNDCSLWKILMIKKWIMLKENHAESNICLLTIISEGNNKGHIMDKDKRKAWDIKSFVRELSDVETLEDKPKIMIVQAYRAAP